MYQGAIAGGRRKTPKIPDRKLSTYQVHELTKLQIGERKLETAVHAPCPLFDNSSDNRNIVDSLLINQSQHPNIIPSPVGQHTP